MTKKQKIDPLRPDNLVSGERFPLDNILRQNGYSIHSRPSGKPPLWLRSGEVYSQLEVERYLTEGERLLARKQIEAYFAKEWS